MTDHLDAFDLEPRSFHALYVKLEYHTLVCVHDAFSTVWPLCLIRANQEERPTEFSNWNWSEHLLLIIILMTSLTSSSVQEPASGQEGCCVQCSLHGLVGGAVQGPATHPSCARQPPECPHLLLLNAHAEENQVFKSQIPCLSLGADTYIDINIDTHTHTHTSQLQSTPQGAAHKT